jgi:hypothetical protein
MWLRTSHVSAAIRSGAANVVAIKLQIYVHLKTNLQERQQKNAPEVKKTKKEYWNVEVPPWNRRRCQFVLEEVLPSCDAQTKQRDSQKPQTLREPRVWAPTVHTSTTINSTRVDYTSRPSTSAWLPSLIQKMKPYDNFGTYMF